MYEAIVFIVLSVISYLFHLLFKKIYEDLMSADYETQGTVIRSVQSDRGATSYYVSFTHVDGTLMEGKSIHYERTNNKYAKGDCMDIKYSINPKGKAQVLVLDSELEPNCNASLKVARNLLIASVIFLIIALILFIKLVL